MSLLAGHDDVDVLAAAQAVIGDGEQAVRVRGQVDPDDLGLLVHHQVDETRILMREAVVVLPPDVRAEQVVERRDRPPPWQPVRHLQPLRMLVEHRVDDVNEGFVAVEHSVPAGQQVALQPALAEMLAQHLHHPPVRGEVVVGRNHICQPVAVGDIEHRAQPVRGGLIWAHQPEVVRIVGDHVAEEAAQYLGRFVKGGARLVDLDRIVAKIGKPQRLQQLAAVGMRVRAHPSLTFRRERRQLGDQCTIVVEQLLGLVAAQPLLQDPQVFRIRHVVDRHLVRTPGSLDR